MTVISTCRHAAARCLPGALLALVLGAAVVRGADPFADAVVSFVPGTNAGFGADRLPDIVLGPPRGAGAVEGGLDVVSLGNGGRIVLAFTDALICDEPGPDFTVFENAFHAGTPSGPVFAEVALVAVSQWGETFVQFPYDPETFSGLAGTSPVYSAPDNGIDPTDPSISGGDSFDLADVGLSWVAYVRLVDPGAAIADPGTRVPPGISGGFDLDAVAAVHSCIRGDSDGSGVVDGADAAVLVAELFDGDGDFAEDAPAGETPATVPGVDVNGDGAVTAADAVAAARLSGLP